MIRGCPWRALILLALAMAVVPHAVRADGGGISWLDSWKDGLDLMKQESRPMMLYFYNDRARPCAEMENATFADPAVVAKVGGFVPVRLHEPQNRALANQYQLLKVPTVIFLDAQGRELDRAVGFKRADSFLEYVERLNARATREAASPSTATGARFDTAAVDISKPRTGTQAVTFTARDAAAKQVFLVGDFNDWREDATPMTRGTGGEWTATVQLYDGIYEYRFKTDDGRWFEDQKVNTRKPNPYGQYNSVAVVGNAKRSPIVSGKSVTFILYEPTAQTVEIAGSFNNWERLEMFRNPTEPGMWGVRYTLKPGRHQYKYVVDNRWTHDPENYSPADDGNGNVNSTFVIDP